MRRYLTVPKLKEALERVYPPPFSPGLERALREIREDAEHGAGQLARQAARALAGARPSMAPLGNIAALVLDEVQEAADAGAADVKALAVEAADGWRRRSEEAAERIAGEAARVLHGVIVTISYSSTVLRALARNRARLERVFVGEGRPGLEGRATARELAQAGIPVVLVTDALASYSVVGADAVAVGADAVTASGAVVNKAGTYALALAARERKVPFYMLADTLKLWPRREPPPLESRPPTLPLTSRQADWSQAM